MLIIKCECCSQSFPDSYHMSEVKLQGDNSNSDTKLICQQCLIKVTNENSNNSNLLLG